MWYILEKTHKLTSDRAQTGVLLTNVPINIESFWRIIIPEIQHIEKEICFSMPFFYFDIIFIFFEPINPSGLMMSVWVCR